MFRQSCQTVLSAIVLFLLASAPAHPKTIPVSRVTDGDTFVLESGEKVRIIGIDAPENDPNSTHHLARLIDGKSVTLEFEDERIDKYGRTLAFVRLADSTDVGARMVQDGQALVYVKYPCSRTDDYLKLELDARQEGRGLWAGHIRSDRAPPINSEYDKYLLDDKPGESTSEIVYVTNSGTKYHRAGCKYLSKSQIPISLEEAVERYGPCSQCVPPTLRTSTPSPDAKDQPEQKSTGSQYWINTGSMTRHNSSCRWYGTTKKGYFTSDKVGKACGSCGG